MNAIRTLEKISSVTNLRGIPKYSPIGFGLFVNVNAKTYTEMYIDILAQSVITSVRRFDAIRHFPSSMEKELTCIVLEGYS